MFQISISIFKIFIFPELFNIAHFVLGVSIWSLSSAFDYYKFILFAYFFVSDIFHHISCYQPYISYIFYHILFHQLIFLHHFQLFFLYLIIIIYLIYFIISFVNKTLGNYYSQSKNFITAISSFFTIWDFFV